MSEAQEHKPLTPADSSPPLAGERVAFTGTLASMTHAQAAELVERFGGTATTHVSRQTTMLVVGEEGWPLEDDGRVSVKLQKANQLRQEGFDIRILKESDWLRLIGLEERERDVQRLFTPAMLSQMLGLSVHTIRRWERLGLIRAVKRTYRLPYFDFREVASARRLFELLKTGVSEAKLEQSLKEIRSLWPDQERPLTQLKLLVQGRRLLLRDKTSLLEPRTGQRHFDFERLEGRRSGEDDEEGGDEESESGAAGEEQVTTVKFALPKELLRSPQVQWGFEQWYEQGGRLLDEGDAEGAVEAFRLCAMERPTEPEVHLHLADALYRAGKTEAALERYHVAVELDHNYLEAWTQIGALHLELEDLEAALQAFDIALSIEPDFPDAIYLKAQTLDQLGRHKQAEECWRRYLEFDNRGPWAEQARMRLETDATQLEQAEDALEQAEEMTDEQPSQSG